MTVVPPAGIKGSGFLRNVAAVAGGAAASQILALLALPFVTRLYLPEHFGVLAVYAGLLGVISVVACLRFDNAIALAKNERAALQIGTIAFFALLLVSIIVLTTSLVFVERVFSDIGEVDRHVFIIFLFLGSLGAGLYQVGTAWSIRAKNFSLIGKTRFHQAVVSTSTQLALGYFGFGAVGLILGQLFSQTAGFYSLAGGLFKKVGKSFSAIFRIRRILWGVKRYIRFPLYDAPAALFNSASAQIPAIVFAAWFSPVLAGFYALSIRVLSAPIGLIGTSVSQVLTPRLVESIHNGNSSEIMKVGFRLLVGVGAIPFALFIALAPTIFPVVFGDSWSGAGEVSAWTAGWLFFQFVYAPLSIYFVCSEAQRLNMAIQVIFFLIRFVPIFIVYVISFKIDPVAVFSCSSVFCYLFGLVVLARFSGVGAFFVLTLLAKEIGIAALMGIAAWFSIAFDVWVFSSLLLFAGGVFLYRLKKIKQAFIDVLG